MLILLNLLKEFGFVGNLDHDLVIFNSNAGWLTFERKIRIELSNPLGKIFLKNSVFMTT